MDPDTALAQARAAIGERRKSRYLPADPWAEALVNAFEALDGWLSHGGFPPKAWSTVADPGDTNRA